jgi:hypothetical protein
VCDGRVAQTHLEALVLQDTLDGGIFTTRRQLRLEDYAKRAVADNLALRVCEVFVVASQAVLNLFADNFWAGVSMISIRRRREGKGREGGTHHPFLVMRRPMAGSGSLFGVMRVGGGPQALRG